MNGLTTSLTKNCRNNDVNTCKKNIFLVTGDEAVKIIG